MSRKAELLSTIYALAATVDSRDRFSHNHSKQVHDYAVAIGEAMGHEPTWRLTAWEPVLLLHDIGKIGINDELLHKKEPLTPRGMGD